MSETYRRGDWVEVLSPEEIFQTLDDKSALENMPFMPEMLKFAGTRLQVSASAHKACDIVNTFQNRKVDDAVHLGVRCDGSSHGGCDAGCLLYWKTSWIKPVDGPGGADEHSADVELDPAERAVIDQGSRSAETGPDESSVRYSCQATKLFDASSPLGKTDVRQYWRDLTSRNVTLWTMMRFMPLAVYNTIVGRSGHGRKYPMVNGLIKGKKTPTESLDLQPGEIVEVKSNQEIMRTLNVEGSNRGMLFTTEMIPFCGKRYRVKKRVDRLLDEGSGEMITMKTPAIILEDAVCMGCYNPGYMFCPRGAYPMWREIWLKRVSEA
ncbi:hypothetical protein [Gordonia hankookensis]|uniref:Uncharacterized protein n=1 Tax=Gordonia hankookensis TaxID=589403 RepID=A0ABR7W871_9ACTN|nr:hypothetical protein [Gordonia hankookensis]MBD1319015.1 hypothetical protein [Gordonia hankookensis]